MKQALAFILFFLVVKGAAANSTGQQKLDKAYFYEVMKSGDAETISNEIDMLKNSAVREAEGYEGALLMKKASLVKRPKERLNLFKAGRIKLETALSQDKENIEFHFLRLVIQEHAPRIAKYHSDIEEDKNLVQKNFKNLPPAVQHAILDYCKSSKVLHKEDL